MQERIGIIGGEGELPALARQDVIDQGKAPFLFEISGITPLSLSQLFQGKEKKTMGLFQLGKLIRTCHKEKIKKLLFVGRVKHKNLYSLKWWKADFSALRMFLSVRDWRADTILSALAEYLSNRGVTVENSLIYLSDYLAPEGLLSDVQPSKSQWEDIIFGFEIAKELSRVDVGQTVLVKRKAIVALEAMEGTDKCIMRAGDLAGKGCVLVKVAKPSQDNRFDVPVVGLRTVKKMAQAGVEVLAVEAKKTLIIDPEIYNFAKSKNIAIVSIQDPKALLTT